MNTLYFIEILDKLPISRKKEVFNFLEFIYQKTMEEDLGGLTKEELVALKERRNSHLKKPESSISIEEAKKKLKAKYGL